MGVGGYWPESSESTCKGMLTRWSSKLRIGRRQNFPQRSGDNSLRTTKVMAHSLESMVKQATLSIVFDEDRRLAIFSTVFRSRYRELIDLAVAAGNAVSFEWLCNRASLLPSGYARMDKHEVLLDAALLAQLTIIQAVAQALQISEASALKSICEKDSTRRHSIFDVVAREGHAELLFNMTSLRFNNEWGNSNIGNDLVFNMCCTWGEGARRGGTYSHRSGEGARGHLPQPVPTHDRVRTGAPPAHRGVRTARRQPLRSHLLQQKGRGGMWHLRPVRESPLPGQRTRSRCRGYRGTRYVLVGTGGYSH
ncbi:hypothetical protein B484DRAFT_154446 [Ochromonadaceae sp. CCMP2298]|nr:hypothetical protein B484DRAFT_154446 [Ochromonadaceae sp. CCMP2298]